MWHLIKQDTCTTCDTLIAGLHLEEIIARRNLLPVNHSLISKHNLLQEIDFKSSDMMRAVKSSENNQKPLNIVKGIRMTVDVDVAILHLKTIGLLA